MSSTPLTESRPIAARPLRAAQGLVLTGLAGLLALIFVRTAWVGDDAYITFRTIDNFLNGHGLRWNVDERVQSYTHPLWLIVLTPIVWLIGNPFPAAMVTSVVLSSAAVGVLLAQVRGRSAVAAFMLAAMIWSKSFTDYSTSGLENALSHLLLASLMLITRERVVTARGAAMAGTLAGLVSLTRLDLSLLAWPIALASLGAPARTLLPFAAGLIPLAAWEIFSVVYYGVPFPNTAYAKLATGVPQGDLLRQGVVYFTDSLDRDPVTLFVIAGALAAGLMARGRALVPALAVALYLVYVMRIGGDFMSGRFFSAPFVVSLAIFARTGWPTTIAGSLVPIALVTMLGLDAPRPTIYSDSTYHTPWQDMLSERGVVDERGFYFQGSGWLTATGFRSEPGGVELLRSKLAKVKGDHAHSFPHNTVGLAGYLTGPDRHIIDVYGLCDPLLARLPTKIPWRIGHFERDIPAGYWASIDTNANLVTDPQIASVYELIREATRSPIWSARRWRAILELNTSRSRSAGADAAHASR